MSEVRTQDEAIARLDKGLATWATSVQGVWAQATATVAGVVSHIDGEVRRRRQVLAAARAAANEQNGGNRAQIARAQKDLADAQQALAAANRATDALRAGRRRLQTTADGEVAGARANLARKMTEVAHYRGGNVGGNAPGVGSSGGTGGFDGASLPGDLTDVDLEEIDYSGNPVIGDSGKGGATRADYAWATETWANVVAPGIARGQTRQDFAERDGARNAPPLRRTADVYDLFTGDSRIVLSRRGDGSLDVVNGRHRIEAARDLGIQSLPARIIR